MLRVHDLCFGYPESELLFERVAFEAAIGETVGLFGLNGSGKSTLLNVIAGLQHPSSGSVEILDSEGSDFQGPVGLVMQNPEDSLLAPTVEEEIALALELRGCPVEVMHEKVERMLEQFELAALRMRPPEFLSGGQKQRVALAAVMVFQPKVLLLDEPDSLLDARSVREFTEAIRTIQSEVAILWSCADADRLPDADRFLLLHDRHVSPTDRNRLVELYSTEEI